VAAAGEVDGYRLHRCPDCSHLFVSDRVDAEVLEKAYDHDFYVQPESGGEGYRDYLGTLDKRIRGFREWYEPLTTFVGGPGRSLDFGCAIGAMVKAAQDTGWDAVGYERSQWAAQYGKDHLGVRIVTGDGHRDPFAAESFDLVTMWDVVEHLEQPREILALVSRWLKPDGWLAVNTVDAGSWGARMAGMRWRHLGAPRHLQYFTRRSLRHLLQTTGYDIRVERGNGVMLEAAARERPLGPLGSAFESAVTHWRARKVADLLNLKDEVEVLARRR
jgi:2-polyprenyl-3-methyl-5-hydroxy-6-metoxy-1,4-benzoquinol methylase